MKKFLFILIIVTYSCQMLSAQGNLPLKFTTDDAKWIKLSWMNNIPEDDQDLLNMVPPLIREDTIYLFNNYQNNKFESGKNYGFCGFIIKKVNHY